LDGPTKLFSDLYPAKFQITQQNRSFRVHTIVMRNRVALNTRNIETYVIRDFAGSKFQISVQLPEGFYESKWSLV